MIAFALVPLALMFLARRRRKARRVLGADALMDALGTVKPHKGPRWRVRGWW